MYKFSDSFLNAEQIYFKRNVNKWGSLAAAPKVHDLLHNIELEKNEWYKKERTILKRDECDKTSPDTVSKSDVDHSD